MIDYEELAEMLKALSDPNRLMIVEMLSGGELCACKLLDTLPETECAILYRYYLARKTVGEIACSLHFTVNYVKRKKAEAVARLEEIDIASVYEHLPDWYIDQIKQDGVRKS